MWTYSTAQYIFGTNFSLYSLILSHSIENKRGKNHNVMHNFCVKDILSRNFQNKIYKGNHHISIAHSVTYTAIWSTHNWTVLKMTRTGDISRRFQFWTIIKQKLKVISFMLISYKLSSSLVLAFLSSSFMIVFTLFIVFLSFMVVFTFIGLIIIYVKFFPSFTVIIFVFIRTMTMSGRFTLRWTSFT